MYTRFFGLTEKPFAITPDPRYLFMSEQHGEALAHLVYGISESGGFIQLTGEVGTGKTTLVRTVLGRLPAEVDVALILNPQLTSLEFLIAICEELDTPPPQDRASARSLVDTLNRHLLAAHARGRRTILLVDEAQNLSADVLEQLRLLTNLETAKQKLLQVILIAQPELRDILAREELRQLAQRVTGRYHLEPLSREETGLYIDHRLKVAGALGEIFDAGAKQDIFELSGGVPRIINVICDRAMLGAYSRDTRSIGKSLVAQAAAEVSGQKFTAGLLKWGVPLLGIVGAGIIALGIWSLVNQQRGSPPELLTVPLEAAKSDAGGEVRPNSEQVGGGSETVASRPLEDLLIESSAFTDTNTAMATLFRLWGIEYRDGSGTACSQAEAAGLSCLFQRGSWTGIRQLDRPVILTLSDRNGNTHQPVLVSLDGDKGELAFGDTRSVHSIDEIQKLWFGEYLLIWRPPNGNAKSIKPGMRDENVRWLRQSLAAIDSEYHPETIASADLDYFDGELEQRLMDFQRRHRLKVDGLAGQQTQIIINSSLKMDGTPRLTKDTASKHTGS
jgi:general secretion pathway protein A